MRAKEGRGSASSSARGGRNPLRRAACALTALSIVAVFVLVLGAAGAHAAARGIVDVRLESLRDVDRSIIRASCDEMGPHGLRARWTRLLIHWAKLQPRAPGVEWAGDADGDGYADAYVAELKTIVAALHATGITVIVTPTEVPEWASDRDLWHSPPFASMERGYNPIYALDADDPTVMREFGRLGSFLAGEFGDAVRHLEVWNEPNCGGSFYPQTRPGDPMFGRRVYLKMLRKLHSGVKAVAPEAVVIAGATAPRGGGDDFSTTPQEFARYLKDHGAQRYFEGYSHHVYPWGPPSRPPANRRTAVSLGNLDVLMDLFPRKAFYVTEFGYCTESPTLLGETVSEAKQAAYLREAYAFAKRRYPRLVTILWFMVEDLPANPEWGGVSMGLIRADGTRKPAWYAFTGGNRLALRAPASARRGVPFTLSGSLTGHATAIRLGQRLTLLQRKPASRQWTRVRVLRMDARGRFATRISQASSRVYRIAWDGVCESPARKVRTP